MNDQNCTFEAETVTATRSGLWTEALKGHVAGCAACQTTRSITSALHGVAARLETKDPLPDPTLIWLKAAIAKRRAAEQQQRKEGLRSRAVLGLAAACLGWAALRWIVPAISIPPETLALSGASLGIALTILYFAAFKPLRHGLR